MTQLRLFTVLALIIAVCGFGQPMFAQATPHFTVKAVPNAQPGQSKVNPQAITPNLYPTWAAFAFTDYPTLNSDSTDIWPCFGDSSSPNPDCPTIGNPSITFPTGGVAVGSPSYTWSLSNCDATSTSTLPCGQTESWYEDDSNDSTDFLIYSITAQQGTSYIADSGTVVFGPNTFGGLSPAANVIIYGDQNFGTMGQTGKNNGNCTADINYPLASNSYPGVYVIAAGKTCVAPVAGVVNFTALTEVATPKYTKSTSPTVCGSVGPPCYTVKFTKKFSTTQKWSINLQ
jgi:hypothetical protein